MDLVIDKNIERELKFLLATIATLSKKRPILEGNIGKILTDEYYIDLITPFIINDYKTNYKKIRNLIHIILYNYNYGDVVTDYVYEEKEFIEMVQTLPIDTLLEKITSDEALSFYLIQKCFHIIFDNNLKEILDNNEAIYESIPWINSWYEPFKNYELITQRLKNMLITLNNYCNYLETNLKDEIFIKLLYENDDLFKILDEFSFTEKEFKLYKPLLIEMLFVDGYYYLLTNKNNLKGKDKDIYNYIINLKLKTNGISILPIDEIITLKLLDYFFIVNENKNKYKETHNKELQDIQKLVKQKANKLLLLEYC